jgi:hypothetical protein
MNSRISCKTLARPRSSLRNRPKDKLAARRQVAWRRIDAVLTTLAGKHEIEWVNGESPQGDAFAFGTPEQARGEEVPVLFFLPELGPAGDLARRRERAGW